MPVALQGWVIGTSEIKTFVFRTWPLCNHARCAAAAIMRMPRPSYELTAAVVRSSDGRRTPTPAKERREEYYFNTVKDKRSLHTAQTKKRT
ncbi:MAG: hypothetical protein ACFNMD_00700 [Prevotella sp.]